MRKTTRKSTGPTPTPSTGRFEGHDRQGREFLEQEYANEVPSGVRPALDRPDEDGRRGVGGGVGKSL
jgi:hypothetical protein